ncbi:hypothetical protein GCM10022198_12750 [Klugiella xanthotipulae]|uniref:Transposase n=1 Tax=Klugiella xanthotipulae TaxID=244735 RepID=A0A543I445_9MICO|nr:transposase [Klugiella xanthotipulae]TQM65363.1 transposase [Klugiella xanthotipulae]
MSRYLEPFKRKVLDLLADGTPVKHVAEDLGISQQTIDNWREQSLVDRGELSGMTSTESAERASARRRIREREEEVRILVRARELVKEAPRLKGSTRPSR